MAVLTKTYNLMLIVTLSNIIYFPFGIKEVKKLSMVIDLNLLVFDFRTNFWMYGSTQAFLYMKYYNFSLFFMQNYEGVMWISSLEVFNWLLSLLPSSKLPSSIPHPF